MIELPQQYQNSVLNCDVMDLLRDLPDDCIDMIFADPDYNAGIVYENRTFTLSWQEYVEWYVSLARESMRVLKPDGNLFFLNYPKQNAHLRVKYLDDAAEAVHDYVWVYNTNVGHSNRKFTTAHRSILHATKSKQNRFYRKGYRAPVPEPDRPSHQRADEARLQGTDALLMVELQSRQERVPPKDPSSLSSPRRLVSTAD